MYSLEIKSSVEKDFRKIPQVNRQKIWEHIQQLKLNPAAPTAANWQVLNAITEYGLVITE